MYYNVLLISFIEGIWIGETSFGFVEECGGVIISYGKYRGFVIFCEFIMC